MISKFISSKNVIAKIFSDLDLQEEAHRVSDMKDWIGEAVEKIGAIGQYENKVETIRVLNYQAAVPNDLYHLNQVAFSFSENDYWIPTRYATGSYDVWGYNTQTSTSTTTEIKDSELVDIVKSLYGGYYPQPMTYTDALAIVNSDPIIKATLIGLFDKGAVSSGGTTSDVNENITTDTEVVYSLKPGYIMINCPTGYVKIAYKAFPMDEDGYPLVPDNASYFEAIYWYVTMKLKYPEYLSGRLPQNIYYDIRNSWNFYRKQAYGEAMMPNEDQMESIKNNWNRLVPEMHEHESFYKNVGMPQKINNWNN